ncbi:MAG: hypothetical protein ACTHK6_10740 [Solirubrobacterales bacterium]
MTSNRNRSDPSLLIAIVAGAVLLAVGRELSKFKPDRLVEHAPQVAPIAIIATGIALALATQRLLATRRSLRSRLLLAAVPADEFKPSIETVLRFASQLSRSDRTVLGWMDRRASAIRVSISSDDQGRLVYLLGFPARAEKLVRSALRMFEGVEIRGADEVIGSTPPSRSDGGEDEVVLRTELVLARPSIEPLAKLALDPDPLQPFAGALAGLQPDRGETATIHLDLLPAAGPRRARLRGALQREGRRRYGGERIDLARLLGGGGKDKAAREPAELAERRDIASALDAKLRDAGPLFKAQILIRVRGRNRSRAKAVMLSLLSAFGPLSSRNWLRAVGLPIPGLAFIGSDAWPRRRRFDRRFASGFFRPARRCIVTASELAGFLKPPTIDCRADNVVRSGALLSPAPPLPAFKVDRHDLIPLGRVRRDTADELVGVTVVDSFFSYIAGRSRYGKTELAIAQFVHLARSGHGGLFLDPHGDALERIKPYLTGPGVAERVVQIDLGPGSGSAPQPGWNLFELRGSNAEEAEARVEAVVDAFASSLEWGERNTRAINLTTQAAIALASIARVLPPEKAPTIFQIPTLLSNDEWRKAVLPFLPRTAQQFWLDRFGRLAEEAITPLTNMVDRLRASSAATALLGQSQSTYRAREAMDRGLIVLACPGSGGARDRLLANLLVFDLFHGAKARGELPPDQRALFFACLDEIQTFDGGSTNIAALVEQTAKFGLRGIFLNQNPERLSPATLNALTTNRSHLVSTALNSHAASLLTREWGGEPSATALTRLPRYRFIAQVTHEGDLSNPFALGGIRVEDAFGAGEVGRVGDLEEISAETTVRKSPAEVLSHLDGLDDAIVSELRRVRRSGIAEEPEEASLDRDAGPISVPRRHG